MQGTGDKIVQQDDATKSKTSFDLKIPGYRIVGRCGGGGTAKVYAAIQESLGRQVALKVMLPTLSIDPTRTHRFLKEGHVIAKLSHPNIVTIHDIGVSGKHHYIAMEYLPWGSLRQRLITKKLKLNWTLKIVGQIALALAYAHENGFIHRDIKPENILFRNHNSAVLSDFGVAEGFEFRSQISRRCNLATPRYMSPDLICSGPIGPSSDIYSLGIVLFEMFTGKPPYNGENVTSILNAHICAPIPVLPNDYRHLQPLINKMLAKDPKDRFSSAREVVNVLAHLEKEDRLPPDKAYLRSRPETRNQPTIMLDLQTIRTVGSTHTNIDQKPPLLKSNFSHSNRRMPMSNDKFISALSNQARIENYKSQSRYFVKLPNDPPEKSTTSLKNDDSKLQNTYTKPTSSLKPTITKKAKRKISIKRLLPSAALSIILSITSLAFFLLVYFYETSQELRQFVYSKQAEALIKIAPVTANANQSVDDSVNINKQITENVLEQQNEQYMSQPEVQATFSIVEVPATSAFQSIEQNSESALLATATQEDKETYQSTRVESKISELLELADFYIQKNHLTEPKGENAFEVFQRIKQFDSDHPSVTKGMHRIATNYAVSAERRFTIGEVERAIILVRRGLRVLPNHDRLRQLKAKLSHYGY